MQEDSFYTTILAELTNQDLVLVIAREMRRRKTFGVMLLIGDDVSASASSIPKEWQGAKLTLSEEMALFAQLVDGADVLKRKRINPDGSQQELFPE